MFKTNEGQPSLGWLLKMRQPDFGAPVNVPKISCCISSLRLSWKLPGPLWKTWIHLQRPSESCHVSLRECTHSVSNCWYGLSSIFMAKVICPRNVAEGPPLSGYMWSRVPLNQNGVPNSRLALQTSLKQGVLSEFALTILG